MNVYRRADVAPGIKARSTMAAPEASAGLAAKNPKSAAKTRSVAESMSHRPLNELP
jgi:hypothetical protein